MTEIATTCIMPLHIGKNRTAGTAISVIIDYVKNPQKTDNGRLITCEGCDSRTADAEFAFSKRQYRELTGKVQENDVIAYHFRQSFMPGEVTPEEANRIGMEFARRFLKGNNAFIVCTHIDKAHVHNHIIWNSTTLDCTRKFRNFWGSTKAVRQLSDTICVEHRLSIIENPSSHGMSYNKWLGEQAKPSNRVLLRSAIESALEKKPSGFEELLALLREAGYEIKRGKNLSFRGRGQARFMRLSSLGEDYSEPLLAAVIRGDAKCVARRTSRPNKTHEPSLLIDIQTKLSEGKGMGYERWAAIYNSKQIAHTFNYLREHQISYSELVQKTDEASGRFNALSAKIKATEKRMAEITELKTQIINYTKTREVFAGYKAFRYSRKYLAEHEADILLHRAAKKRFNELGLKKLPTVRSLQTEYAELLREKKADYVDYRQTRDEMRELLIIRANADQILGKSRRVPEKESERNGV